MLKYNVDLNIYVEIAKKELSLLSSIYTCTESIPGVHQKKLLSNHIKNITTKNRDNLGEYDKAKFDDAIHLFLFTKVLNKNKYKGIESEIFKDYTVKCGQYHDKHAVFSVVPQNIETIPTFVFSGFTGLLTLSSKKTLLKESSFNYFGIKEGKKLLLGLSQNFLNEYVNKLTYTESLSCLSACKEIGKLSKVIIKCSYEKTKQFIRDENTKDLKFAILVLKELDINNPFTIAVRYINRHHFVKYDKLNELLQECNLWEKETIIITYLRFTYNMAPSFYENVPLEYCKVYIESFPIDYTGNIQETLLKRASKLVNGTHKPLIKRYMKKHI